MGAGLLVGTALSVIIPEGMQTLNMAYSQGSHHSHGHEQGTEHTEHSHTENPVPHIIGVSLVLGFLFQLIVDQVATAMTARADVEGGRRGSVSWTATLGLVVHAAADGVALGAAATTNQTDVEIIVFLAIMLHKAPASFGLVTFLLHEGLERTRIRKHLLVFSLAAPVLALVTYLLLTLHGHGNLDTLSATGTAMLFSAGTFLYVATVHVLPEVARQVLASDSRVSGDKRGARPLTRRGRGQGRLLQERAVHAGGGRHPAALPHHGAPPLTLGWVRLRRRHCRVSSRFGE